MIKISAIVITLNEERNIERCLLSLQGVADEVIVIDSYSTDQTEALCKAHGALFYQKPWKDYSDQKNHGNALAKNNWILSLDADEALSPQLRESILEFKKSPTADACKMSRMTNYCGSWIKHCGWYPDTKLRLWNRQIGHWEGEIHEYLKLATGTKTIHLAGDIHHYSFYTVSDHAKTIIDFTEKMARENVAKGKKATRVKIFINPIFKFFQTYILRLGILDGYHGLVICILSSYAAFFKYARTRELQKSDPHS